MTQNTDNAVEVIDLSKNYGPVTALKEVSFSIESGKYFVLLGPSGGGKTTLLRLIGGFIRPTAGTVLLHGRDVTELAPNERPTSMVFQSYALFPHMSVAKNVGYGLKLRRMRKAELDERVEEMLAMVGLEGYGARMPHELSGGQQQRVQLARSLVLQSDVLLLDEPLAALDAKLRKDMCLELKRIQEKVGITFIHVTHNQEEAMTVADRIAIVAGGELVEQGAPRDVYERPVRRFTADFIGENNLFDGKVTKTGGNAATIDLDFATVQALNGNGLAVGQAVALSIRSELLALLTPSDADNGGLQTIPAEYLEEVYLGLTTSHLVRLPNQQEIVVRTLSNGGASTGFEPGQTVTVGWKTEAARLHPD